MSFLGSTHGLIDRDNVIPPVAAQERQYDPHLGTTVAAVGADSGASGDRATASPPAPSDPTRTYVFGCVSAPGPTGPNGAVRYVASRYAVTTTGDTRDTLAYTDPACTIPLPPTP